uniref:Uncharacterized protein n=1 Tax=Photinus pyralis TaxID=7054 RepID=A0A1Y1KWR7_PHOPY
MCETLFKHLYEELRVIHRNLLKDSVSRRNDPGTTERKFNKVNKLEREFEEIRDNFNKNPSSEDIRKQVKQYVEAILKYFELINQILDDRIKECKLDRQALELGTHSETDIQVSKLNILPLTSSTSSITMGEKFNLKTAGSLLPLMDGSEETTKRLVDAIELYNGLLDEEGKKLLITYVLKTRLTENAKIRLQTKYEQCDQLIKDLQDHFLPKISTAAVSAELHKAKQKTQTIDDFGKQIENLLTKLTIAQADGNNQLFPILQKANEKIAIHTFANGLKDPELRTIIKARDYSKLADAIKGAMDEGSNNCRSEEVYRVRFTNNFRSRGHNTYQHNNNYVRGNQYRGVGNNHSNQNYQFRGNSIRGRNFGHRGRNNYNRQNNFSSKQVQYNRPRVYTAKNENTEEEPHSTQQFFRAH